MKRYDSRYCTFAVPDDWAAEPPFAFVGKDAAGRRCTAQVLERCLPEPLPVATHLQKQKDILSHIYEGFELVSEGPHRPEGVGEGFTLTFNFIDEEENKSQARAFHLTIGSLICQLILAGPDQPDRDRDRLLVAIAKSFALHKVDFLTKVQSIPLTSEILRVSQPVAARGWQGAWRKFPRACISLPTPSGWEVTESEGDALFHRGSAEIRAHRDLEGHSDSGSWLTQRMERLQDSGDLLLALESGEVERGSYAAVLYEERGIERTWRTAAVNHCLEIFISDKQPLLWALKAPESAFHGHRPTLESLTAASKILDPEEWETKLSEPWLDYVLKGPWQPEGGGIYTLLSDSPELLLLNRELTKLPLETVRQSIIESLRAEADLQTKLSEKESLGALGNLSSFQYSLEGTSRNGKREHIRALGSMADGIYFGIIARGPVVANVFPEVIYAFKASIEGRATR